MNKRILTSISSCALAAAMLCTGAAAQAAPQDGTAVIDTENTGFSDCVEQVRSVYTERYPEQVDEVNSIIDGMVCDETFLNCYNHEGNTAFRILEDTLTDALTPTATPYGYDGTVAFTWYTFPDIAQIKDGYCGVAATQMALIGSNLLENNSTNSSSSKQSEIALSMGLYSGVADIAYHITPYMNNYYPANASYKYRCKAFPGGTIDKMMFYLSYSLRSDAVPILLFTDTSKLGYYNGYKTSHYVAVSRVDTFRKTITVSDPFHSSTDSSKNASLFGTHIITYDELCNAAKSGYIWASVYSSDTGGAFDYIY